VLFALIGEIANQASINLAGSLTFTVVCSSVTIFTACLGIPLLGARPSRLQWLALVTIVAGLLSAALSHTAQKGKRHTLQHYADAGLNGTAHLAAGLAVPQGQEHLQEHSTADSTAFAYGAGAGIVGSLAYALVYVITELIQQPSDAPPPEVICSFVGLGGTAIVGGYIAVWDGPRWQGLVTDQLTASYATITSMYALIVIAGEQPRSKCGILRFTPALCID
jgi:drug/metabolite transporter (DMT)-like permease